MSLLGKCKTCNKKFNFFRFSHRCDFCQQSNCKDCIEELFFADYEGNLEYFTEKLPTMNIALLQVNGYGAVSSNDKFSCIMCSKCKINNDFSKFKSDYDLAVKNSPRIDVFKQRLPNSHIHEKSAFYEKSVFGSKLRLIELLKIKATLDGYDFIYELFIERNGRLWSGSCKAGRKKIQ